MKATLYVIGIGPGGPQGMTYEARAALEEAEVIVGYKTYVDLVRELFPEKEFVVSGMGGEQERCQEAIALAVGGQQVALISSGDAGVYGMASLALELAESYPHLTVKIIAGVSAAHSGSAVLGAPLSHDYAVLSLSDYLTPPELIRRRLQFCAAADLCIAIYNPRSKARADYLAKAVAILLEYKSPATLCAYVRNIGREGEEYGFMSLRELQDFEADMLTTIFVGNKDSKLIRGKMVTPRGYRLD